GGLLYKPPRRGPGRGLWGVSAAPPGPGGGPGAARGPGPETGVLWRIELAGDEAVVMVEVVNSTPEPDGSSRTYWLRVPPRTTTAREGVAWTFGLPAEEYEPQRQT
ncbi:DUF6745 domain-containing protein, partial [Streptomyces sp. HSW2009]|uniref:DUF6745 domain-containing protein n=1 Tax=Streptomyces sp. HSW2009 TaxID=3142890 RepID=UPI0032EFAA71